MPTIRGFSCAGLLVAAVACGPTQPDYQEVATAALTIAGLNDVSADYVDSEKAVHLTGTVATEAARRRAGDLVREAVGPDVLVANEVTVEGGHTELADDFDSGIETHLETLVEGDQTLKQRSIEVDANNGVVTLTGAVATEGEKSQVGDLARQAPGVRDVINSLEVHPGAE